MKKIIPISIATLLLAFCVSAHADIVQKSIVDFSGVQDTIDEIKASEKKLLILDFQDTTLSVSCDYKAPTVENCPYIGSRPWFNWQLSLLENEPDSEYLVAKNRGELIEISNVFLESALMEYTEESIPALIDSFSKNNVDIMFVTQYGSLYRIVESKAILSPLNEEKNSTLADVMAFGSPKLDEPLTTLGVCNSTEKAKVNYQNGILYTAGENISGAIECFLGQYTGQLAQAAQLAQAPELAQAVQEKGIEEKAIKVETSKIKAPKIIYVNDSYQEIAAFYDTFRGNNKYHLFALHYTKADELWKPLLADGKEAELQTAAHKKWLEIKEDILKKVYLDVEAE